MGWSALVQDEPRVLLHDYFNQPRNYLSIIGQVASSAHSPKEMAEILGLEPATVSNYLHTLVRLGLLRREVPATERDPERSRKSRYEVADPYLRFYYRFLEPQLANIIRGAYRAVWQTIERHWRAFVGTHTFEEMCREWVYAAAESGRLPFLPQRVGSHWSPTEQISLTTRGGNPLSRYYAFFSRAGFTEAARALAEKEGAILVDLAFLDEVLAEAIR